MIYYLFNFYIQLINDLLAFFCDYLYWIFLNYYLKKFTLNRIDFGHLLRAAHVLCTPPVQTLLKDRLKLFILYEKCMGASKLSPVVYIVTQKKYKYISHMYDIALLAVHRARNNFFFYNRNNKTRVRS